MSARAAVIAVVLLVVSAACGSADRPETRELAPKVESVTLPTLDPTCIASVPVDKGATVHIVESGGVDRAYVRYVPPTYEGVAMPVVLNLSADGATAAEAAEVSGLDLAAEGHGFITLTPQAAGVPAVWDTAGGSADIALVHDLLDAAEDSFCLDRDRVYVVGLGEGALLAGRLACDLSDRIAAVGLVADVGDPDPCEQKRPVPVIGLFGDNPVANQLIPPPDFGAWVDRYECDRVPRRREPTEGVTRARYLGCAEGAVVEFYALTVPPTGPRWPANPAVDTGDLLWEFFAAHPLTT